MKENFYLKMINDLKSLLRRGVTITPEKAARFFKTGPGDYAQGEIFLGITMPHLRKIVPQFAYLSFDQLQELLNSYINEERLIALLILIYQYQRIGDEQKKQYIYEFYLKNIHRINNWNLVDVSCHLILGAHLHLYVRNRDVLLALADSDNLWRRRIAIVSTWFFIRHQDLTWTFKIAQHLIKDEQDLIRKAVGWMLREAGKKDEAQLVDFLAKNAAQMPRVMLRYAIEKFDVPTRKTYLMSPITSFYRSCATIPKSFKNLCEEGEKRPASSES